MLPDEVAISTLAGDESRKLDDKTARQLRRRFAFREEANALLAELEELGTGIKAFDSGHSYKFDEGIEQALEDVVKTLRGKFDLRGKIGLAKKTLDQLSVTEAVELLNRARKQLEQARSNVEEKVKWAKVMGRLDAAATALWCLETIKIAEREHREIEEIATRHGLVRYFPFSHLLMRRHDEKDFGAQDHSKFPLMMVLSATHGDRDFVIGHFQSINQEKIPPDTKAYIDSVRRFELTTRQLQSAAFAGREMKTEDTINEIEGIKIKLAELGGPIEELTESEKVLLKQVSDVDEKSRQISALESRLKEGPVVPAAELEDAEAERVDLIMQLEAKATTDAELNDDESQELSKIIKAREIESDLHEGNKGLHSLGKKGVEEDKKGSTINAPRILEEHEQWARILYISRQLKDRQAYEKSITDKIGAVAKETDRRKIVQIAQARQIEQQMRNGMPIDKSGEKMVLELAQLLDKNRRLNEQASLKRRLEELIEEEISPEEAEKAAKFARTQTTISERSTMTVELEKLDIPGKGLVVGKEFKSNDQPWTEPIHSLTNIIRALAARSDEEPCHYRLQTPTEAPLKRMTMVVGKLPVVDRNGKKMPPHFIFCESRSGYLIVDSPQGLEGFINDNLRRTSELAAKEILGFSEIKLEFGLVEIKADALQRYADKAGIHYNLPLDNTYVNDWKFGLPKVIPQKPTQPGYDSTGKTLEFPHNVLVLLESDQKSMQMAVNWFAKHPMETTLVLYNPRNKGIRIKKAEGVNRLVDASSRVLFVGRERSISGTPFDPDFISGSRPPTGIAGSRPSTTQTKPSKNPDEADEQTAIFRDPVRTLAGFAVEDFARKLPDLIENRTYANCIVMVGFLSC